MRLYDAHNHLQDERFGGRQEELVAAGRAEGVEANCLWLFGTAA